MRLALIAISLFFVAAFMYGVEIKLERIASALEAQQAK